MKVTTICYGQKREWPSKKAAMDFFLGGVMCCDGCERERYSNIYTKLNEGFVCADDSDNWNPDNQGLCYV